MSRTPMRLLCSSWRPLVRRRAMYLLIGKRPMRLVLIILILLSLQQTDMPRLRLLLRDETDAGVAGATLTLRTENGQTLQLTTDANGVAVSDVLAGKAVWLMSGRLADGRMLV